MTIRQFFCLLTIFAALLSTGGFSAAADGLGDEKNSVKWYSYESGMEKLRESGKKGFIHFYTDWCSYCRLMDEKTFSDKNVADYMNGNFISMRVNAEKEQKVARSYKANRFPFNWFIDDQTDPIGSQPGYIPPEQMIQMLKYVRTESYETMKFSEFVQTKEQ